MTEETKPNGSPKPDEPKPIATPRCPICHIQEVRLQQNIVQFENGLVACYFWCGACGSLLTVHAVKMPAPLIATPDLKVPNIKL